MKPVIIIAVAVGSVVTVLGIQFILNSDLDVNETACDVQKDQIFEMGKRFEEIRELQKEIPPGTDDYITLDQEFQKLTDEALEKRNWYIANCV
jgi:cell division protein FtsI/penicillin-binding protein 2